MTVKTEKKITMKQILALKPCESSKPLQYADENWSGTILDVLKHPDVPPVNKIWVVVRSPYLNKKQSVAFANFCAEQAKQFSDAARTARAARAARTARTARTARAAADAAAYAAGAAQVEQLIKMLKDEQ
jgi:hypothetical protein